MNLLKETLADIIHSGHEPKDIIFIGSQESGHSCTWEEFQTLADFDYDAGYGSQNVATDLIVVFKDGSFMRRYEYGGSEEWDYFTPFKMPEETKPIRYLTRNGYLWNSLEDIQTNRGRDV
jgi:hypothetical protein